MSLDVADLLIIAWTAQALLFAALGVRHLRRLWITRDREGLLDAAMTVLGALLLFAAIVVGVLAMGLLSH